MPVFIVQVGADCSETGVTINTVASIKGYFAAWDGTNRSFYSCFNEKVCAGGGRCAVDYTGLGCTECDGSDLVLVDNFVCDKCGHQIIAIVMFVVAGLIWLAYFMYALSYSRRPRREKNIIYVWMKIFFASCYIASTALSFTFNFDDIVIMGLSTSNRVQSLGTSYLEFECLMPGEADSTRVFETENIFYLAGPLVFTGVVYLLAFSSSKMVNASSSERNHTQDGRNWISRATSVSVIFMFLAQPTLSERVWMVWACTPVGLDDLRLLADLNTKCWTELHWKLIFLYGMPMLTLYAVGIPLFGVCVLVNHKFTMQYLAMEINPDTGQTYIKMDYSDQEYTDYQAIKTTLTTDLGTDAKWNKKAEEFQSNYGFLFIGYELKRYWWEGMIYLRKISLGAIAVFRGDPYLQTNMALIVLFTSSILHTALKPFQDELMDTYETCSLYILTFLFLVGQLSTAGNEDLSRVTSGAAMCLFGAWIAVSIVTFILVQKHERARKDRIVADPEEYLQQQGYANISALDKDLTSVQNVLKIAFVADGPAENAIYGAHKKTEALLLVIKLRYEALCKEQKEAIEKEEEFVRVCVNDCYVQCIDFLVVRPLFICSYFVVSYRNLTSLPLPWKMQLSTKGPKKHPQTKLNWWAWRM